MNNNGFYNMYIKGNASIVIESRYQASEDITSLQYIVTLVTLITTVTPVFLVTLIIPVFPVTLVIFHHSFLCAMHVCYCLFACSFRQNAALHVHVFVTVPTVPIFNFLLRYSFKKVCGK